MRCLLVGLFLWAQFMGLVHAYEHHEEEHEDHQCVSCVLQAYSDDPALEPQIIASCWVSGETDLISSVLFARRINIHTPPSRASPHLCIAN